MSKEQKRYFSSNRIETLTDGIFAIAMTLLVLDLRVPELASIATNQELNSELSTFGLRFFIFALSFYLLATAWGVHHRQFANIKRSDNTLMWLNMLRLFFVVLVPFSTSLVADYSGFTTAAVVFLANMLAISVVSYIQWTYAFDNGLMEGLDADDVKRTKNKSYIAMGIPAICLILAFFAPNAAIWGIALLPVLLIVMKKVGITI